jgi:Mn2+/Fe2+ NRAMP family transporter
MRTAPQGGPWLRLPRWFRPHRPLGRFGIAKKTIVVLTASHLFIVFFRSHGNQEIFRQFPMRFTVVPIALFVSVTAST